MTSLKYIPYSSAVDTGFWHELTRRKLDIYRLDSSNIPIVGYYSNGKIKSQLKDDLLF
jgi:ubiquitin-like modifier-activating enzyme ATG7